MKKIASMRNRAETEKKILQAVREIVTTEGFKSVGINTVARKAGCDKVLVYRYFGNLDGLLERFARSEDFWMKAEKDFADADTAGDPEKLHRLVDKIAIGQLDSLLANPALQEILRWQLMEKNILTDKIDAAREKSGRAFTDKIVNELNCGGEDLHALTAIMSAGLYYLVLRSRTAVAFNGVELDSEKGWERIRRAILRFNKMVFDNFSTGI